MLTIGKCTNQIELGEGTLLGAKVGGILAFSYSLTFTLLLCYSTFISPELSLQQKINWLLLWLGFNLIVLGTLASITATVIGIYTGLIIIALIRWLAKHLSKGMAFIFGMLICCCIAYPVNQFFWPLSFEELATEFGTWYVIGLGIPSIIYIISGGWVSLALYKKIADNQVPEGRLTN